MLTDRPPRNAGLRAQFLESDELCGLEHVRETIPFPRMLYRLSP